MKGLKVLAVALFGVFSLDCAMCSGGEQPSSGIELPSNTMEFLKKKDGSSISKPSVSPTETLNNLSQRNLSEIESCRKDILKKFGENISAEKVIADGDKIFAELNSSSLYTDGQFSYKNASVLFASGCLGLLSSIETVINVVDKLNKVNA